MEPLDDHPPVGVSDVPGRSHGVERESRITVHLFASAREAVGRSRLLRRLDPPGASLKDLLDDLVRDYPKLAAVVRESRIALNGEYVDSLRRPVHAGDEVAVHPPYSGG